MIRIIKTGNPEYRDILELRNRMLRIPLGMDIRNDDLSDEPACQFLAYFKEEGEILGCLKIKKLNNNTYQFLQMAVEKDYQGKGIGSVLLEEAEALVRSQGATDVVIDARDYAIPFYAKNGYQAEGDLFVKINIPHQRMIKPL